MASTRSHRQIEAPADEVWRLIRDPDSLPSWFQSIAACVVAGDVRTCTLVRGGEVRERIVTCDDELRRFQYTITDGMPVTDHLATIDVIAVGAGSSIVIYSTEVSPDRLGAQIGSSVDAALSDLQSLAEASTTVGVLR
jgi:carbon monoxide dehydrogenase subunit G